MDNYRRPRGMESNNASSSSEAGDTSLTNYLARRREPMFSDHLNWLRRSSVDDQQYEFRRGIIRDTRGMAQHERNEL
jgi:hypothetical protein